MRGFSDGILIRQGFNATVWGLIQSARYIMFLCGVCVFSLSMRGFSVHSVFLPHSKYMLLGELIGNLFRVYPASRPMKAWIGSSRPLSPCVIKQVQKVEGNNFTVHASGLLVFSFSCVVIRLALLLCCNISMVVMQPWIKMFWHLVMLK